MLKQNLGITKRLMWKERNIHEFRAGSFKNPKETDPESGVQEIRESFDTIIPSLELKEQYLKREILKIVDTYSMKIMTGFILNLCLV